MHSRPVSNPALAASKLPEHTHINVTVSLREALASQSASFLVVGEFRSSARELTPAMTTIELSGTDAGKGCN